MGISFREQVIRPAEGRGRRDRRRSPVLMRERQAESMIKMAIMGAISDKNVPL